MRAGAPTFALPQVLGRLSRTSDSMAQGRGALGRFKLLLCLLPLLVNSTQAIQLQPHTTGGLGRVSQHTALVPSDASLGNAHAYAHAYAHARSHEPIRGLLEEAQDMVDRVIDEITIRNLTTDIPAGPYRLVSTEQFLKQVQEATDGDQKFVVIAPTVRFLELLPSEPQGSRYVFNCQGAVLDFRTQLTREIDMEWYNFGVLAPIATVLLPGSTLTDVPDIRFENSHILLPCEENGVGELLDIGPDTPLVFPKFKGSSTKIGPSQVLLSNSTVRCLDSAQLDRLADTLRADEPGSELQNRLHPGWWVLVASATVVACCCLAAVAAIGYVFTRKHLAGAHIQGEEDFQDEIPPPPTDEHHLEAVESVVRTPYSGTPPVSPKEAPERRTAWAFGSTMSALAFSESKSKELHQSEMGELQSTMGDNHALLPASLQPPSRLTERQNDPVSR